MNTLHVNAPSPTAALQPSTSLQTAVAPAPEAPLLEVCWARHEDEVRQAQRLRYRVFAEEMGAKLSCLPGTPAGLDVDAFDAHCKHLLVRTRETALSPSEVVGTYRVLTPAAARRAGGLYSDQEFDLSRLDALRPHVVELGRSCTAPAWRSGGVILMLWGALADFMLRHWCYKADGWVVPPAAHAIRAAVVRPSPAAAVRARATCVTEGAWWPRPAWHCLWSTCGLTYP
ncbi:MAG: GNAT family N-acetyltransferase [Ideonella sp.]|nr:GNAT family N-acetyltransferase [Ideonella sp.]